jgi:hypothetical protein
MANSSIRLLDRPAVATEELAPSAELIHELDSTAVDANAPESLLPKEFLLGTLGDARFRVVRPLQVVVSTENDDFIANADEIDEFGYGPTQVDALRDLQRTIVALFLSLERDDARLGPDLRRILAVLRQKIRRSP